MQLMAVVLAGVGISLIEVVYGCSLCRPLCFGKCLIEVLLALHQHVLCIHGLYVYLLQPDEQSSGTAPTAGMYAGNLFNPWESQFQYLGRLLVQSDLFY